MMKALLDINNLRKVVTLLFLTGSIFGYSQVNNDSTKYYYPANDEPHRAFALTDELKIQMSNYKCPTDSDSLNVSKSLWFYINATAPLPAVDLKIEEGFRELKVYGPFTNNYTEATDAINSESVEPIINIQNSPEDSLSQNITLEGLNAEGLYLLKLSSYSYESELRVTPSSALREKSDGKVDGKPRACAQCLDGEMPEPGNYLFSAWVSMDQQDPATTQYDGPEAIITTTDGTKVIDTDAERYIIDGWELIEGTFIVPLSNEEFRIQLKCSSSIGDCYFDDIRFLPLKASMKTYVYDPVTMRLAAELDERHYSTRYEYDEDGQLKRIKKETERGVKTIQESSNKTVIHAAP